MAYLNKQKISYGARVGIKKSVNKSGEGRSYGREVYKELAFIAKKKRSKNPLY